MRTYIQQTAETLVFYWFDRSLRLWTAIWVDEQENQIGEAQYCIRVDLETKLESMAKIGPQNWQV